MSGGLHINGIDPAAPRLSPAITQTPQHQVAGGNEWYLIRTKTGYERIARDQLRKITEQTLVPLGTVKIRQQGRTIQRVSPIFPCYIFSFFSLGHAGRQVCYTPGVREIVRFGDRAAVVPAAVIEELIERCSHGPVDLSQHRLSRGSPLKVIGGPLRDFDAVFDGYLNGTDRVAVLLSLMNAERRAVLPTAMVIPAERPGKAVCPKKGALMA